MKLHLNPPWSNAEIEALERLYKAGWRWPAIAAQVSSIRGVERTPLACQTRAGVIGILDPARKGNQLGNSYDAVIAEMMDDNYTLHEMVDAIRERYGVKVSATYVSVRARKQNHAYTRWKKRANERMSKGVTRSNYRTGRSPDPASRNSRLRTMGIPERSFYSVREELRDMGVEHTEQDIIEICRKRKRA